MSNLLKNLLIVLGLVVLLWLGYMLFFTGDESTTNVGMPSEQASAQTQEFLTKLQLLRSLRIEGTIFSDIRFTSLIDLRQELLPEKAGRPNPFAPVQ